MDKGEHRKTLTSEEISKKFKNQFDFVNYAIKLAENMIQSGRMPHVSSRTDNPALIVLDEILAGKDKIEQLPTEAPQPENEGYYSTKSHREPKHTPDAKKESFHFRDGEKHKR